MSESSLQVIRLTSSPRVGANKDETLPKENELPTLPYYTSSEQSDASVAKYVLRVKRMCFEPRFSHERNARFIYLTAVRDIFEDLTHVFDVHIETLLHIAIAPIAEASDGSSPARESNLVKPVENLMRSHRKRSASSDSESSFEDVDEKNKAKDFVFSYLFEYRASILSAEPVITVDKLLTFKLENAANGDFYTQVSKILGNFELLSSKDKEIIIKSHNILADIEKLQLNPQCLSLAYSYEIEDWIYRDKGRKGSHSERFGEPDLIVTGTSIQLNSLVIDSKPEMSDIKHYLLAEDFPGYSTVIVKNCYLHNRVERHDMGAVRNLVFHSHTVEQKTPNAFKATKLPVNAKIVGELNSQYEQWLTQAKKIKLYQLQYAKKSSNVTTVLNHCNLFKSRKSNSLDVRAYGFTETMAFSDVFKVNAHLETGDGRSLKNDASYFSAKHVLVSGTASSAFEALNLVFPRTPLFQDLKKDSDSKDYLNTVDWMAMKGDTEDEPEFEVLDPSLFDSLDASKLERASMRAYASMDALVVRLYQGEDFVPVELSDEDQELLDRLCKHSETKVGMNSSLASQSFMGSLLMTKTNPRDGGVVLLPRLIDNKRKSAHVELRLTKCCIEEAVVRGSSLLKYGLGGVELREKYSIGSNDAELLFIPGLSLRIEKAYKHQTKIKARLLVNGLIKVGKTAKTDEFSKAIVRLVYLQDIDDGLDSDIVLGFAVFQLIFLSDPMENLDKLIEVKLVSDAFDIIYSDWTIEDRPVTLSLKVPSISTSREVGPNGLFLLYEDVLLPAVTKANPHLNVELYLKRLPVFLAAYQSAVTVYSHGKQASLRDPGSLKQMVNKVAQCGKTVGTELVKSFWGFANFKK